MTVLKYIIQIIIAVLLALFLVWLYNLSGVALAVDLGVFGAGVLLIVLWYLLELVNYLFDYFRN